VEAAVSEEVVDNSSVSEEIAGSPEETAEVQEEATAEVKDENPGESTESK